MAKTSPLPKLEYLKECFEFNKHSPSYLSFKLRPRNHFNSDKSFTTHKNYVGKFAGTISVKSKAGDSYFVITLNRKKYFAHRIVLSLFEGKLIDTETEVDHKDQNGLNNNPRNLRKASHNQNQQNTRVSNKSSTGHKGVYLRKYNMTYYGIVKVDGVTHRTRFSKNKDLIIEEVRELRESLHKEFTHHG